MPVTTTSGGFVLKVVSRSERDSFWMREATPSLTWALVASQTL